jgi:hypothetical protein
MITASPGICSNTLSFHAEIGGEQKIGRARHPSGDGDRFIRAVVEHDNDFEIVLAGILKIVAVALRHVADIAGTELIEACTSA